MPDGKTLEVGSPCHATALRKAARHLTQFYDAVLSPSGLRSTQRAILVQVGKSQGLGMGELADHLVLDRSALTHNLKPLIRDGLVTIGVDPADRRGRAINLTPMGADRLALSNDLWNEAQNRYERSFGQKEARDLRRTLGFVADVAFGPAEVKGSSS